MNQAEIAQIVAAVVTVLSADKPTKKAGKFVSKIKKFEPKLSPAIVNSATEKQLVRFTAVARAFNRKGLKNTEFTLQSGGSDTVRTYKGWLANGRIVRRGQHGVKGLFHITQTEEHIVSKPQNIPSDAIVGSIVSVA